MSTMRASVARFKMLSAALRAADSTLQELEAGAEREAFQRVAASLWHKLLTERCVILGHGIHCSYDLYAYVEVALADSEYEARDGNSQFDSFGGKGTLALVCLFEAFIEWRRKSRR